MKAKLVILLSDSLEEMKELLEDAKCKHIPDITSKHVKLPKDWLEEGVEWLTDLKETTYREAEKIWVLHSKDAWENYRLMGIEDLAESILLVAAQSKLRRHWSNTNRPKLFKKTKLEKILGEINNDFDHGKKNNK